MAQRRPLRLRTCESCSRNFYSRSTLSRFCCVAHQVRTWRANNKATQEQLEREFLAQEMEKINEPLQGVT
jgi:hypothetical protein